MNYDGSELKFDFKVKFIYEI